jgi:hypothetical protein
MVNKKLTNTLLFFTWLTFYITFAELGVILSKHYQETNVISGAMIPFTFVAYAFLVNHALYLTLLKPLCKPECQNKTTTLNTNLKP